MKKLFILLFLFSTQALAENHFYAGTNLSIFSDTEVKTMGVSLDDKADVGVSGFVGYSHSLYPGLDLGFEAEYQHFGKAEWGNALRVESDAYYLNLRPKWVEEGNPVYSALIIGVGVMDSELSLGSVKASESEMSYQVGFELGYMIKQWDIGIGYRYQTADFGSELDGLDISRQGVTLTARFRF